MIKNLSNLNDALLAINQQTWIDFKKFNTLIIKYINEMLKCCVVIRNPQN